MKTTFYILIACASINLAFTQNLTIDELASLRKQNFTNAEEMLSAKAWNYIEGSSFDEFRLMKYAYGKNNYDNKAQAFLTYGFSATAKITRIDLSFFSDKKYNEYLNRVKALGCKLASSKINEDGEIVKFYKGKTTTFRISLNTNVNEFDSSYTIYSVMVLSNDDYEYNFNPANQPSVWEEIPTGDYTPVNDSLPLNTGN